jgi:uncharacterized protein
MRRMIWHLFVMLIFGYTILVALVFVMQSRLIYFPDTTIAIPPQAYGLRYEDVRIRTEDGETLGAWWIQAPSARGTVLLFHGNAGNISHRIDYAKMFQSLGYSILLVDYRGYGTSTGSPSENGMYRDAAASWHWLTETRGIKPTDIVIFGESLGGGIATWLAVHEKPGALVLASTFTSVPDLAAQLYPFLPVRLISRYRYRSLERVSQLSLPIFIAHSPQDEIIPYSHGRRLFEAAREPKTFLEMQGGHNEGFVFARTEWVQALKAFLDQSMVSVRK